MIVNRMDFEEMTQCPVACSIARACSSFSPRPGTEEGLDKKGLCFVAKQKEQNLRTHHTSRTIFTRGPILSMVTEQTAREVEVCREETILH